MEMIIYTLNIKTLVIWHRDFYGCQGYKPSPPQKKTKQNNVITKRKN